MVENPNSARASPAKKAAQHGEINEGHKASTIPVATGYESRECQRHHVPYLQLEAFWNKDFNKTNSPASLMSDPSKQK